MIQVRTGAKTRDWASARTSDGMNRLIHGRAGITAAPACQTLPGLEILPLFTPYFRSITLVCD